MGKKKIATKEGDVIKEEKAAPASESVSVSRKVDLGKVFIKTSFNNTIITVTDERGNVLAWGSAGSIGFSGPKKATPFAASKVVSVLAEKLKKSGLTNVEVIVKGVGGGRDSAVRSLVNHGFNVVSLKDMTPIPHNGPRPPKTRRV